ncbi:hypothetical protein SAMN04489802_4372 [Pseudomonas chlororaphis]|uniref:DUF5343 domain-containing protein n=1 Tax=Pseudomonas chlororaphis TaxID=587753 RepID=UPI0008650F61|nr:DUF5343 domain-containing protein [Pseudomonas chlororaphis]AZD66020.1 hypothetical protein C4K17_2134 [Pseudomonas chlororaphis subsp. aurantiaca]MBP5089769.1 DUF5343 domain-containing protein [Pseudomonas chlororaphis]QIT22119.1 DUF5343 domain-containing protein [Pseudomonas chlororaphis subsp. aurantiaca]WDH06271.1 DUF5343 domain-containing protein [Pseudomonas chlororaphis]WDH10974.1 DUF5343 domain-containing protein [Pseudomonas chlororaphis]
MADKHPYMSGTAGLVQAITQLRRAFPAQVTAETLKKLQIAPNNETYVLNILRFINVLDSENKKNAKAVGVFNQHDDEDFQKGLSALVKPAYQELFEIHGEHSWNLPLGKLISFFRNHDHTSEIVGKRQASTFQALAVLCGQAQEPAATPAKAKRSESPAPKPARAKQSKIAPTDKDHMHEMLSTELPIKNNGAGFGNNGVALTVRVEINLPAGGEQETYDRIFKSIRENLLNGNDS